MILTTHALVGAVIGKNIASPWWIILLSLVVHFFLDSFRHGEYFDHHTATFRNTAWKVSLDMSVAAILLALVVYFKNYNLFTVKNMLVGVFFSLLPDGLSLLYFMFHTKFLGEIKKFHFWAHRRQERKWGLRNAINDIIISLIIILLLIL